VLNQLTTWRSRTQWQSAQRLLGKSTASRDETVGSSPDSYPSSTHRMGDVASTNITLLSARSPPASLGGVALMMQLPTDAPILSELTRRLEPLMVWLRVVDHWLSYLDCVPPIVFMGAIFVLPMILVLVLPHPTLRRM
jgi:hypothetical protein